MNGLELVNVELLVDDSNLEVDVVGGRQIDPDLVHIEPQEEALHLDPLEARDGTVAELPRDFALVVNEVIELHVAGFLQINDESAIIGERVVGDRVR